MNKNIYEKITAKKEISQLPEKDVELAFSRFDKERYSDEEKIKLTRGLLHKVFSGFLSEKLLKLKNKEEEWFLRKHLSTRERLPYYKEVYSRILKGFKGNVIDLGAGANGFSYKFFFKGIKYIAVEAVGQLVELMNYYFKDRKINGKAYHLSLFELEKVKELIKKIKGKKIVFLFKVIDCLEMLERDYSKELLLEISSLADKIVVSFATKSMGRRENFRVNRNWIINFIKDNFRVEDDFELGGERYISFRNAFNNSSKRG